jgi:ABC-type glycerol-3-phosphate transport system permease component
MAQARHRKIDHVVKHGWLLLILGFAFMPLYLMLVISFKTNEQFQKNPWFFDPISEWQWQNWSVAWEIVRAYISNSIFVSVLGTSVTIVIVLAAAYTIARYRFPGRNLFFYLILGIMFLPGTAASLVTTFNLYDNLNLVNSIYALVLNASVAGQVMGIFLLKNFIEDIPRELFESVQIDGGGHFTQIRHVVIPMSRSVIGVAVIMDFLGSWNNTIFPFVMMRDPELYTIPVGLLYLEGEYVKQWGEMMAGFAIGSVPLLILFLFSMKLFVKGLGAGAIKG